MNHFEYHEYFPGVYHINSTGALITLMVFEETKEAILFDTGYGFIDPRPFIGGILEKYKIRIEDLQVVLSHAHHDHILGGRWFESFYLHKDDAVLTDIYTGEQYRKEAIEDEKNKGRLPQIFDRDKFFSDKYSERVRTDIPVFGKVECLHIPGHTPGSMVLYLPEYKLLLTGDNWNPTTWLFFPEALPVRQYAENMKKLLLLDFKYVLCSHSPALIDGTRLHNFIHGLTEKTFTDAVKTRTPYPEINTMICHPEPDTNFIFRRP